MAGKGRKIEETANTTAWATSQTQMLCDQPTRNPNIYVSQGVCNIPCIFVVKCVYVYVCVCVCMCVRACICAFSCVWLFECICLCLCIKTIPPVCARAHSCVRVSVHVTSSVSLWCFRSWPARTGTRWCTTASALREACSTACGPPSTSSSSRCLETVSFPLHPSTSGGAEQRSVECLITFRAPVH